MIERLLFSLSLISVSGTLFLIFRQWQIRRAGNTPVPVPVDAGRTTLLYFRSDHCAPCMTQAHYLRPLRHTYDGRLTIREIDVDRESEMASCYGVFTLPSTLIVDRSGQVRQINYGLTGSDKLAQQLENVI